MAMTPTRLINIVENAIGRGLAGESSLDMESFQVNGFSTASMRRIWNLLCREPMRTYLEVGAWRGATAVAAACNNRNLKSFIVDDFSQPFGVEGVKEELLANLEVVRPKTGEITFMESDCWKVNPEYIKPIDVFFYDGEHGWENTSKSIPHFFDALSDTCIIIFDDTGWETVQKGLEMAFAAVQDRLLVEKKWEFRVPRNDDPIWHNSVDFFVCSKIPSQS